MGCSASSEQVAELRRSAKLARVSALVAEGAGNPELNGTYHPAHGPGKDTWIKDGDASVTVQWSERVENKDAPGWTWRSKGRIIAWIISSEHSPPHVGWGDYNGDMKQPAPHFLDNLAMRKRKMQILEKAMKSGRDAKLKDRSKYMAKAENERKFLQSLVDAEGKMRAKLAGETKKWRPSECKTLKELQTLLGTIDLELARAFQSNVPWRCAEVREAVRAKAEAIRSLTPGHIAQMKEESIFCLASWSDQRDRMKRQRDPYKPFLPHDTRNIMINGKMDPPTVLALRDFLRRMGQNPGFGRGVWSKSQEIKKALHAFLKTERLHNEGQCSVTNRAVVRALQQYLLNSGHWIELDGKWGAQTTTKLQQFLNSAKAKRGYGHMSVNVIAQIQEFLVRSGDFAGPINGLWYKPTIRALQIFLDHRTETSNQLARQAIKDIMDGQLYKVFKDWLQKEGFFHNTTQKIDKGATSAFQQFSLTRQFFTALSENTNMLAEIELCLYQARTSGLDQKEIDGLADSRKRLALRALHFATEKLKHLNGIFMRKFRVPKQTQGEELLCYQHMPIVTKALQGYLLKQGYANINPTGQWGLESENALEQFLRKNDCFMTVVDNALGGFEDYSRHHKILVRLQGVQRQAVAAGLRFSNDYLNFRNEMKMLLRHVFRGLLHCKKQFFLNDSFKVLCAEYDLSEKSMAMEIELEQILASSNSLLEQTENLTKTVFEPAASAMWITWPEFGAFSNVPAHMRFINQRSNIKCDGKWKWRLNDLVFEADKPDVKNSDRPPVTGWRATGDPGPDLAYSSAAEFMIMNLTDAVKRATAAGLKPDNTFITRTHEFHSSLTVAALRASSIELESLLKSNTLPFDNKVEVCARVSFWLREAKKVMNFANEKKSEEVKDSKSDPGSLQKAIDTTKALGRALATSIIEDAATDSVDSKHSVRTLELSVHIARQFEVDNKNPSFEKIALHIAVKQLEPVSLVPQRQPTVHMNMIEKMTRPAAVEIEKKRVENRKTGKFEVCQVCEGKGHVKNEGKGDNGCWICAGTGKTSKWLTSYKAANDTDDLPCMVCYDRGEWGVSTECSHFFCSECIKGSLEAILDSAQFPAYCPMCRAEAGGKPPNAGRIEDEALTFLERRGVISRDFQFRFMKQQKKGQTEYFRCPAMCGNFLQHMDAEEKYVIEQGATGPIRKLKKKNVGQCPCGILVCLFCHAKIDPTKAGEHDCEAGAKNAKPMDEDTKKMLQKNGKKCPNCGNFIEKAGGCNTMMCGTHSHGSLVVAIRNGGCGHQFYWDSLKPASTSYKGVDENGAQVNRSGFISAEERLRAMKIAQQS